ncbi:MAG: energy transducer TonB [Aliarcobacter sp.]|nr:energy transducer TonB [Aliarcobacter sp.]
MKIIILALIVSISLHFLAFYKYKDEEFIKKNQNDEKITKTSDVKFVKLKKQEEAKEIKEEINEVPKLEKISEPRIPKEKVIKEQIVKKSVENKTNNSKPIIKNENIKAKNFQEKVIKEQIVNKNNSLQNSILEDFLSQKEPINKDILNELEKLYGKEYHSFTKVQKAYLEKNLNNFQVITQRVLNRLGYPRLAAKLRLSGVNIVEFMFHPDGSITNLKITSSSGYEIFDKYSLELIEIAYKDYPRPETSTKLKFNVNYQAY